MNPTTELEGLERQKAAAKEAVEKRKMLERLSRNPDFKKLILETYIVDEAARMIGMSGDVNIQENERTLTIQMAQAPGHLKRWFSAVDRMGLHAEQELVEVEETRLEIEAEGND